MCCYALWIQWERANETPLLGDVKGIAAIAFLCISSLLFGAIMEDIGFSNALILFVSDPVNQIASSILVSLLILPRLQSIPFLLGALAESNYEWGMVDYKNGMKVWGLQSNGASITVLGERM